MQMEHYDGGLEVEEWEAAVKSAECKRVATVPLVQSCHLLIVTQSHSVSTKERNVRDISYLRGDTSTNQVQKKSHGESLLVLL